MALRYTRFPHSVRIACSLDAVDWCINMLGPSGIMNPASEWDIDYFLDKDTNMQYNVYYFSTKELLTEFILRWL